MDIKLLFFLLYVPHFSHKGLQTYCSKIQTYVMFRYICLQPSVFCCSTNPSKFPQHKISVNDFPSFFTSGLKAADYPFRIPIASANSLHRKRQCEWRVLWLAHQTGVESTLLICAFADRWQRHRLRDNIIYIKMSINWLVWFLILLWWRLGWLVTSCAKGRVHRAPHPSPCLQLSFSVVLWPLSDPWNIN
jgi:hypothetical protein